MCACEVVDNVPECVGHVAWFKAPAYAVEGSEIVSLYNLFRHLQADGRSSSWWSSSKKKGQTCQGTGMAQGWQEGVFVLASCRGHAGHHKDYIETYSGSRLARQAGWRGFSIQAKSRRGFAQVAGRSCLRRCGASCSPSLTL